MVNYTKTLRLGGARFSIKGIGPDDPYFASLRDGYDDGFDDFCAHVLRSDDVCLDIGANLGLMSLMIARHVPSGRVIAVEGSPTVARLLAENVTANQQAHITPIHAAIGDHTGTVRFQDQSSYGHIATEGVEVPLMTLADVMAQTSLHRLDFIKIDVEGHEFPILRHVAGLLRQHQPVLFLEFNSWCQLAFSNVNPIEFATWLLAEFSHVYRVVRDARVITLERIPADGALVLVSGNITRDGAVTDLVATNAPQRLTALLARKRPPLTLRRVLVRSVKALLARAGLEIRRV